jgi:hypothetical protein
MFRQEKRSLLNIIDINHIPLVSLQESCLALESLVPSLQDHVEASYMWAESLDSLPNGSSLECAAGS